MLEDARRDVARRPRRAACRHRRACSARRLPPAPRRAGRDAPRRRRARPGGPDAARAALRTLRGDLVGPRGEARVDVGGRDDRRHALRRELVEQRVALCVVGRSVVDPRHDVHVHVDEGARVRMIVHEVPIDAERGGLEQIAIGAAPTRARLHESGVHPRRGWGGSGVRLRRCAPGSSLTIAAALIAPAPAQAVDLYVDPGQAACSDAAAADVARNPATPWCTPAAAAGLAAPGDTVHLASTTYHAQLRPLSSGTPSAPIVYAADGPVTIVAPEGSISVHADRRARHRRARLHRACGRAAGDLDRRGEQDPARSRDRRERARGRRADQARQRRHDRALAAHQQRARGPLRHDPGARHDAARVARGRQRPRRRALQRRRRGAQQHGRDRDRQPHHRQRRQPRLRARHLHGRERARLHDLGQPHRRQRRRRREGRGRARARRRQPSQVGALRPRAVRQPRAGDRAVQPHPGPLPARRDADEREGSRACAAVEQHRAPDRPLDEQRQRLGRVRR